MGGNKNHKENSYDGYCNWNDGLGRVGIDCPLGLKQQQDRRCDRSFCRTIQVHSHGIGLEFTDKKRLIEFFQKAREFYPDYASQVERVFVSGDHVITEWTLRTTLTEPFFGALTRQVPVSLPGVSIIRVNENY